VATHFIARFICAVFDSFTGPYFEGPIKASVETRR
jgi:hypothetical protein